MIRRALWAGNGAILLLAEARFGSKAMIRLSQESALVAILRTKKNKFRVSTSQVMLCFKGNELRNIN